MADPKPDQANQQALQASLSAPSAPLVPSPENNAMIGKNANNIQSGAAEGVSATAKRATFDTADSDDDEEDEKKVLEESPCGRWAKTKAQVKQRDVPGIDVAYLAMDNETGQEVVWNEVQFSERKNFKAQEGKMRAVFTNLMELEHANLVKFYKYWTDAKSEKPRIVFITEYMSSGSMSQFLKRTKKGNINLSEKSWKKWCVQILSALSYLHSCEPCIVHGNLSCNTIFIQQNGLIKIGCVAPNAIHQHVKTFRENMKNMHYIAPEYEKGAVTPAADIYAFGICALEMAILGFSTNGDGSGASGGSGAGTQVVTQELIDKKVVALENPLQKDFIQKCLRKDPENRPTARELLFHTVLFGVHSLKLLAAHCLVMSKTYDSLNLDDFRFKPGNEDPVIAEIKKKGDTGPVVMKYSNVEIIEELDKFVEDVSNGIYPLYAFELPKKQLVVSQISAGETAPEEGDDQSKIPAENSAAKSEGSSGVLQPTELFSASQKNWAMETRKVIRMSAEVKSVESGALLLKLLLRLDDNMNRELSRTGISPQEEPAGLAEDLVVHGFICQDDKEEIAQLIRNAMTNHFQEQQQKEQKQQPQNGVIITTTQQ